MANHKLEQFEPLDPGRINSNDPLEWVYWCTELHCRSSELADAVAKVGEHVAAVRALLESQAPGQLNH